jgi:hypothetical protein
MFIGLACEIDGEMATMGCMVRQYSLDYLPGEIPLSI